VGTTAAAGAAAAAQQAAHSSLSTLLISVGIFVMTCAVAVFLICAVPTLLVRGPFPSVPFHLRASTRSCDASWGVESNDTFHLCQTSAWPLSRLPEPLPACKLQCHMQPNESPYACVRKLKAVGSTCGRLVACSCCVRLASPTEEVAALRDQQSESNQALCQPCAQAWRRTAQSVEALALSLQREVPDTAATMRLSGLELADAIGEVTLLGADLTEARAAQGRARARVRL